MMRHSRNLSRIFVFGLVFLSGYSAVAEPLQSWNKSKTKTAIVDFVERVTQPDSRDFVPVEQRIAVFDNDGTLWSEQPAYFQLLYVIDRVKALAPRHPEWKTKEPFAAILKGDLEGAKAGGMKSLGELLAVTHSGMTTDEFEAQVANWISTARHPQTNRPYTEMVFQPMLELLQYLRGNQFKTFIVSGGGVDFMRVFVEQTYGIPPEQTVGSSLKAKYELRDGVPVIVKLPEINFIDDKEGKPVGIYRYIGRRPIFAAGNSDADMPMLEWTTTSGQPGFGMLVHHTDANREYAYDRKSSIGKLDKGLDGAARKGWFVVDMEKDWSVIYPAEKN